MQTPSVFTRDLARRLLASSRSAVGPDGYEALVVSERLRGTVSGFAGAAGFASLQRRAWVLASAEVPALRELKVGHDGQLQGWAELFPRALTHAGPTEQDRERTAAIALTAHLLELMVTFIGRPLTLRLLLDAWPDASTNESKSTAEAES
ncbi:MAG TPA: hypothetical protein VMZ90_01795 [Vicinamibacterales bacterium]|nr:hypothetical protein [Vicinamibacterales bacterium]